MKTATKRTAKHVAVGGCVLVAVGLNVGWWAYDRAGVTLRKLRNLKPGGES